MKTTLLTLTLLTAKPDTTPYLHHPYYSEDTACTNYELRIVNHKNAVKLKDYDRHTKWLGVVALTIGVLLGIGINSIGK